MAAIPADLPAPVAAALRRWHEFVRRRDMSELHTIVHPDAIFRSPMAFAPYQPAAALILVISTVMTVFEDFEYQSGIRLRRRIERRARIQRPHRGQKPQGRRYHPLRRGRQDRRVRSDGAALSQSPTAGSRNGGAHRRQAPRLQGQGVNAPNARTGKCRTAGAAHSRSMRMTCGFSAIWPSATMAAERLAHRGFGGRVGHQHHRHHAVVGGAGRGAGRCFRAKCRVRPCGWRWPPPRRCGCAPPAGCNSRPRGAASAIFRPAPRCSTGRPKGAERMPRAMSAISATTAEAVAMPPAPGPTRVSSLTASASTVTALVTPITWAIDDDSGTMVGCTRCSTPCGVRWATPEQFDAIAEFGAPRGDRPAKCPGCPRC